ncbi:MAG: 2-dehydropantoate 2-reductase [Chloroflexota bacterium]
MRIAVFGSGAVGGYFGARLIRAGEQVCMMARGEHLRAIRASGLRVEGASGDFVALPHITTDQPQEIGVVDLVIVGVKAWQITEAAQAMSLLIGEHTMVLPLQNGVEASARLADVLGASAVLVGLCQIAAQVVAPGVIRHAGIEPYLAIGELDGTHTPRLKQLQDLFIRAGVKADIPADIYAALWDKFLFIAAFSAVGAVTRSPAGVVRQLPQTRALLEGVMGEIYRVALANGVHLDPNIVSRRMAFIDSLSPQTTASMTRDILEGRPSELDDLIGAVTRIGKRLNVPTPLSDVLYACLLPQELRGRGNYL